MASTFISIFNDVIGPIMRGPSSSHTAGAYRIAKLARSLYGTVPTTVRCSFDPEGSYAPTYLPLGVDKAFCAGLIGMDMLDSEYESAVERAESAMDVDFAVESLQHADHPNTMCIELKGDHDLTVWAKSTGGGVVEIFMIDDSRVAISGKEHSAVVMQSEGSQDVILQFIAENPSVQVVAIAAEPEDSRGNGPAPGPTSAIQLALAPGAHDVLDKLASISGADLLVCSPVFFPQSGSQIADSAAGLLAYATEHGISLGQCALAYESEMLGMSEKQALSEMERRYEVMRHSISEGYELEHTQLAWLEPHALDLKNGQVPYGGYHTSAAARAHAVMHTCNSRGVVCAAPTGGAAGVLPGVLVTLEEEFNVDRERILRAMFAAGAIGLVMAIRATFAAESAGCQVEIGIAGAMAAAAAVDSAGGSAEMAMNAAAISLQNTMGSICDPVGGGCEIPCHTRNGVAASSAFTCADLVWGGYKNPIPLDETIDASYDVGKRLHADFRCTARGGIAVTPSRRSIS